MRALPKSWLNASLFIILLLLAALLATPALAQPPTPSVTMYLDNNGRLTASLAASTAANRFEIDLRIAVPGARSFASDWQPYVTTNANINFSQPQQVLILEAANYNASFYYEIRARVWNSASASSRSGWAYAGFGPRPWWLVRGDILDGRVNTHPASPVTSFIAGDHLVFYAIDHNSVGQLLGVTPGVPALLNSGAEAGTLARWRNPVSGKPVIVVYNGAGLITVGTYYADTPYDTNKPVIFTIDQQWQVEILAW